ncbi:MAG: methylmalonyl-CoA epimerase [Dehalococcoidia bacterium]|nr:methylmalonyl-CoA epimerase [Dehalococcoidia bacterium]
MVKGIAHIAVLVKNLDETLQLYQDLFGAKLGKTETLPEQGVKTAMVDLGGATKLEILEPLPGSNMAKVLEKRGEGIHHICLEVDNTDKELDSLAGKGVDLIDKKARRGVEGMVAFIHPKSLKGVLVELCQMS